MGRFSEDRKHARYLAAIVSSAVCNAGGMKHPDHRSYQPYDWFPELYSPPKAMPIQQIAHEFDRAFHALKKNT